MWDSYYIIIIILVFLKVMFWTFYFYIRAQRYRTARAQRRFVVVETRQIPHGYNDRSAIVNHEVLPDTVHCPPAYPVAPPAYDVAVQNSPNKPPTYEQAVSNNYVPPQAMQQQHQQQPQQQQVPVVVVQAIPPNNGVRM